MEIIDTDVLIDFVVAAREPVTLRRCPWPRFRKSSTQRGRSARLNVCGLLTPC